MHVSLCNLFYFIYIYDLEIDHGATCGSSSFILNCSIVVFHCVHIYMNLSILLINIYVVFNFSAL